MSSLLLILLLVGIASAQIPALGNCPDVQYMNDFDVGKVSFVFKNNSNFVIIRRTLIFLIDQVIYTRSKKIRKIVDDDFVFSLFVVKNILLLLLFNPSYNKFFTYYLTVHGSVVRDRKILCGVRIWW